MSLLLTSERLESGEHVPGGSLSERIAEALGQGERWFSIWGDDPYQHIAVAAFLERADDLQPLDAPRLDDPFATAAAPAVLAYRPLGPNGLASTFGLSGRTVASEPGGLSGNLDVGRVVGRGGASTIMVVGATVERQRTDIGLELSEVDRRPGRQDPGNRRLSLQDASLVITNGQFLLNSRVAPRAVPYDGAIDVGVMRAGRFRESGVWRKIERGDRVPEELFSSHLVDSLSIDGEVFLAVDAHVGIEGPARIQVVGTPVALWV
jgi:hypothetical protein